MYVAGAKQHAQHLSFATLSARLLADRHVALKMIIHHFRSANVPAAIKSAPKYSESLSRSSKIRHSAKI
jgi:hypothetical protein